MERNKEIEEVLKKSRQEAKEQVDMVEERIRVLTAMGIVDLSEEQELPKEEVEEKNEEKEAEDKVEKLEFEGEKKDTFDGVNYE